jgi:predicted MFS family arabinose efflux permease
MLKQLSMRYANLEIGAAVGISLLVQTAISMLGGSIPLLAPTIADARGWKVDLIAFYAPMVYAVAFVINFRVPHLLARFGGMGLNLMCVVCCAIGLACVLFDSLAVSALSTVAIGVAMGMMNPASAQVLGPRTSPATAGMIMAIKQTGVPLGGMLAGVITPIIAVRYGWEWAIGTFIIGSAIFVAALLPTVQWLNGDIRSSNGRVVGHLDPIRRLLEIPGMWTLITAGAMFSAALVCLRTFISVYLVKELGFNLELAGFAFSASQAAGLIGQIGWAALSDRILSPHRTMGLIGFLIAASATLMATFSGHWSTSAICVVVGMYGAGAAGFVPLVLGEVARRAKPGQVGAVTSAANLFLLGGVVLGPMLFGGLASLQSYSIAFGGLAGCVFIVSAITAARKPAFVSD